MDIPDKDVRRQGYATETLGLFIQYLKGNGIKEIYTQTWSGNLRIIGLAHKLGFKEINRKYYIRMVRNEKYDGLTFKLIE
ncbi:Acetyltransferase (GNAT) family [Hathewaya histolytica]|uniref:Acetyltransferase (GNAT) family n=1 Tax=Hathewaya histolytica TaxID=1498 RepID=A0A4U9R286_HATHI|nr:Acetyltransferase (GNAT) family [Hathewaya histolytica]